MDDNGNPLPSQEPVARPRLLKALRVAIELRHYSLRTAEVYLYRGWRFIGNLLPPATTRRDAIRTSGQLDPQRSSHVRWQHSKCSIGRAAAGIPFT